MGRLLFGIFPFLFGHIWKRLVIVAGVLIAAAVIIRVAGMAGPCSQIVLRLVLGLMAFSIAAVLCAPFRVRNDLLVPWAVHRETGTPPPLKEEQEVARQKIRNASKEMPKGGSWALGVRIVYTPAGQIVWIPTQVVYGALGTTLGMVLLASLLGNADVSANQLLDEQYTLPVILVGGAAGLIGGSIARSFVEALLFGLMSFAFTLAAAVWSSAKLQPWLKNVIPGVLYAQFWTLIVGRLFLPRLRRLGRMFHYGLVAFLAPAVVVAGIFYLAHSHVAGMKNQLNEQEITVSWMWTTPDGRLLVAGRNELYGSHWLLQRKWLGGFWSIDPKRNRLEPLIPDRAVTLFLLRQHWWRMKLLPGLDRIALTEEPSEIGALLERKKQLSVLQSSGRIEPLVFPELDGQPEEIGRQLALLGMEFNQQDAALISKTAGEAPGAWTFVPYPGKAAILLSFNKKQALIDLKNDRAVPVEGRLESPTFLVDGPRGREILFLQYQGGGKPGSRVAAYNLQQGIRTVLTGWQTNLVMTAANDDRVLVRIKGHSKQDRRYGVTRLEENSEFKELVFPGEKTRFATITPAGPFHVWTDKNLRVFDPASWAERTIPRQAGLKKSAVVIKGYLGKDPILLLKTDSAKGELKRLDLDSGKLKTLVAGRFK